MILSALIAKSLLAGATVTVPVEAKVRGTEIELGELCLVAGVDGELVGRVRALELGYAPAPGFSRLLTADRIRSELARAMPGVDIRVIGERACRVWPEIEEIGPEVLEQTARVELTRVFLGKEATFTLAQSLNPVKVPMGEHPARVVAIASTEEPKSGVLGIALEIQVDGVRYRTVWSSWRVDVWETRPVLSRPVRAGEELSPDLFTRRRVQLLRTAELEPLDPRASLGAVAARDLAAGERVSVQDVHRPAAVTLGSMLFLRVRKGPIEARVSALALETGSVGDRIRIKTVDAGQEMVATVVARDVCEISL